MRLLSWSTVFLDDHSLCQVDNKVTKHTGVLSVSKGQLEGLNDEDVISRQDHEQETEKLELEIQQCKEMIKAQQQLLQVNGSGCPDGVTEPSGCLLLYLLTSVELAFPISVEFYASSQAA